MNKRETMMNLIGKILEKVKTIVTHNFFMFSFSLFLSVDAYNICTEG